MSETTHSLPAGQPVPEPGVEPDNIDAQAVVIWGVVSVVVVIAFMLGSAALYFQAQNQFNESRIVAPPYFASDKVVSDQQGVLASYGPPASEGKPYKIPIKDAKKLILAEIRSKAAE